MCDFYRRAGILSKITISQAANHKPQTTISINFHFSTSSLCLMFHLPFLDKTFTILIFVCHTNDSSKRIAYIFPLYIFFFFFFFCIAISVCAVCVCVFDFVVMNRCDLRCLIKQIEKNKHFAPTLLVFAWHEFTAYRCHTLC